MTSTITAALAAHVTINNPDTEHAPPAYEGPADKAYLYLTPGTYPTTDGRLLVVQSWGWSAAITNTAVDLSSGHYNLIAADGGATWDNLAVRPGDDWDELGFIEPEGVAEYEAPHLNAIAAALIAGDDEAARAADAALTAQQAPHFLLNGQRVELHRAYGVLGTILDNQYNGTDTTGIVLDTALSYRDENGQDYSVNIAFDEDTPASPWKLFKTLGHSAADEDLVLEIPRHTA